jgi:DNA-binding NtrC family response regulator
MARVLIVDDESHLRRILTVILRDDGHEVLDAEGLAAARSLLETHAFDVVVTDHRMPDGDGLGVLAACQDAEPALPVIFLTAHATVELAVDAMRHGAFDFITKPFQPGPVRAVIRRAHERVLLVRENRQLREDARRLGLFDEIVGSSPAMQAVRADVARVAPTSVTVLVTGETGTGKELVARAIHRASPRAGRPFVAVNCAALPETLLESELFGHERGAFTGADRARQGLFEAADGGTLFLDEAGEMPLALQAKLLRVLTDGQVVRVGATTPRRVDVRVIVATHRDLKARIADGSFREDLYYRVAVVPVHIPALRERREDIRLLIAHLLDVVARELKLPRRDITREAVEELMNYAFPGNVRELRNLVERAYILARHDALEPEDFAVLPADAGDRARRSPDDVSGLEALVAALPGRLNLRATLEEIERRCLVRALRAADGVQAEAGRALGLSRSDMAYKIRKHQLTDAGTA